MFKSFKRIGESMSGLKNMHTRIQYQGGANQQDRMAADKLKSLRKALLYSYQSATIVVRNTDEDREFRALINPNKVTMELDDKVISIPFEDVRLNAPRTGTTTEGIEPIGVKVGDVIEWKHKDHSTFWLVYDQYLQEIAYFRGQMRKCEDSDYLEIGGKRYYYYLKGPDEKGIDWQKTKHFIFNDLNYSVEIYISKTTETDEFFQRFKKLMIKGKPFEVQAVDRLSSDGILTVYLKEDYSNEWEAASPEIPEESVPSIPETPVAQGIIGPAEVYPYDIVEYSVEGLSGGQWSLSNKRAQIVTQSDTSVVIEVVTGRSGDVSLIYTVNGADIIYNISILSL